MAVFLHYYGCDTTKSNGTAMTPKNGPYFEINRIMVFAMRSVGKGNSTAKNTKLDKFTAFCTPYLLKKTYRSFYSCYGGTP